MFTDIVDGIAEVTLSWLAPYFMLETTEEHQPLRKCFVIGIMQYLFHGIYYPPISIAPRQKYALRQGEVV